MSEENKTQAYKLAYEASQRQVEVVCDVEKARQLRLNILMLEDANDDLHTQLAQDDEHIQQYQKSRDEVHSQLENETRESERVRADLRLKNRELDTLKVRASQAPIAVKA